jgi:hypothetical protein
VKIIIVSLITIIAILSGCATTVIDLAVDENHKGYVEFSQSGEKDIPVEIFEVIDDTPYTIGTVFGSRKIRVIEDLGWHTFKFRYGSPLSQYDKAKIEIKENMIKPVKINVYNKSCTYSGSSGFCRFNVQIVTFEDAKPFLD